MKISYNWLKQYINTAIPAEEAAKILTQIGLEVESIEPYQSVKGGLEGFVIGKVLTCEKMANSDKLSKTTVDVGGPEPLHIVCGAPNVKAGQKVVVATEGTIVYMGDESFKIKKSKLRGEASEGMICAEDELGLGTAHDGIMVLPDDVQAGTLAKDYFEIENDISFEIGLTPNRIDAASHYGVARDLAAYLRQSGEVELSRPSVDSFHIDNTEYPVDVEVINTQACPRYAGVTVSGVKVGPSPKWMQNRLQAIGLRSINNVVDVTNYILYEIGQPLHSFDADKIKGKKIVVRTLPEGTKFTTLDGVERDLSANDLMICNESEPMALAGVFGGSESGVTANTTNVFLESAYFNPVWVRKTAKRLGLNTDASFRFERGIDPNITIYALKRAALLIRELAGGEISSEIVDQYPSKLEDFKVDINFKNVNRLVGKVIPPETIRQILTALEIKVTAETSEGMSLIVPAYRVDVQREADVVEEILRIYGYNNVEISPKLHSTIAHFPKPDKEKIINLISDLLSDNGFNEIMSNSLTKASYYENTEAYDSKKTIHIFNPLSSDLGVLRQTMLHGGLEAIALNTNRRNKDLKLYEFGNCYVLKDKTEHPDHLDNYSEKYHLALFLTGLDHEVNWITREEHTSFYLLKTYVEMILKRLGVDPDSLEVKEFSSPVFSEAVQLSDKKDRAVTFGVLRKDMLVPFDIKADVYYADFQGETILELATRNKINFNELPKYPAVKRDLALLLDKEVKFAQVKELAFKTEHKLLKKVSLFDVYEGDKLPEGKKSYAVSFILQDESKTLNDNQIDKAMKTLLTAFEKQLGAQIR